MTAANKPDELTLTRLPGDALSARQLHDLLKLRVDVFVVEQHCPYPELDGQDLLPTTTHVWLDDGRGPVASIRVLDDPQGRRIGRVVTRSDRRGERLAGRLMFDVLASTAETPTVLDAQSHLAGFYEAFGYAATGPEYVEDGIPHIPMRRNGGLPTKPGSP